MASDLLVTFIRYDRHVKTSIGAIDNMATVAANAKSPVTTCAMIAASIHATRTPRSTLLL
ncbi:hypothetical protein [Anaplasma platys]|uniref:hypothetical protein n=1 Tax=Anaplasma platys TaxID=949 RepID=UPI00145D33E2|nr:hypothetical protein [Anaplasma platys]